jgi:hypothetical protein
MPEKQSVPKTSPYTGNRSLAVYQLGYSGKPRGHGACLQIARIIHEKGRNIMLSQFPVQTQKIQKPQTPLPKMIHIQPITPGTGIQTPLHRCDQLYLISPLMQGRSNLIMPPLMIVPGIRGHIKSYPDMSLLFVHLNLFIL